MGYKGLEMTSQDNYIWSDVIPYNPDFDMEELKIIQNKLQNYTSGKTTEGITSQEAEIFLDWVTFNARNYAVRHIPESPITSNMAGQCAPTQRVNSKLLSKIGLNVKTFNTSECIGNIPMNEEDKRKVLSGWLSSAVRHSISLVNIPIIDNNGETQEYKFLLDPTFRQFCLKENCASDKFFDENWLNRGYAAPHPGYFMQADNLTQLGVPQDVAQKSESLGKYIVSRGYFYLNEENAKLYADAFQRASRKYEFQYEPIEMSGKQYIENFENIPMKILEGNDDVEYIKLPTERKEKKGIITRIFEFFKKKLQNPQKMLPAGEKQIIDVPNNREGIANLTPEQMSQFREGEKAILNKYNEYEGQYTTQEKEGERDL